jgi:hypothetical protein
MRGQRVTETRCKLALAFTEGIDAGIAPPK